MRASSNGTIGTSCSRRIRSPTGRSATSGATSRATTSRTTRCTTAATRRSAACRARAPPRTALGAAGRAAIGWSAACTDKAAGRDMDPAIVFFGACVGLLVGMTGVGGGSLMTPLLIIVFGVKPVTAVGTDLSYAAVTKTVGGVKHLRQRTVDMRLSTWMALGFVPAAIGGVYALKALQRSYGADFNDFIFVVLAAALLLTGVAVLGRALLPTSALERQSARLRRRDKLAAVSIGLSVGFVLGLTSAGSGALIAVALILVFRLVPIRVVGTDVFHAAILLWASAIAHIVAGDVDLGLAGTILIASVPGVWVGSHLSVRL